MNPLKPVLCKGMGKNDDKSFENKIMTTGLAGGLIQPYKGTMPAALEAL